jgi:hypothetical protein
VTQRAFVWDGTHKTMVDLGTLNASDGAATESLASGVDENGVVYGWSGPSCVPGTRKGTRTCTGDRHAARWTVTWGASGAQVQRDDLGVGSITQASQDGRFLAGGGPDGSAYVWSDGGATRHSLLVPRTGFASAVTANAQAAGTISYATGFPLACFWPAVDAAPTVLGPLVQDGLRDYESRALDVSGTSSAGLPLTVGWTEHTQGAPWQPTVWTPDGSARPLGTGAAGWPQAIDSSGTRVAGWTAALTPRALLWRDTGGWSSAPVDLTAYVSQLDSRWTLKRATDVDSAGDIVGWGAVVKTDHAYLLTGTGL